jgi:transposase InsO family protein
MAIDSRQPSPGGIIHGDHGTQFTSWAFTTRAKNAGLLPSLGTVGDPYDNAVVESFWGRMQVELLNRRRWRTREAGPGVMQPARVRATRAGGVSAGFAEWFVRLSCHGEQAYQVGYR